MQIYGKPFQSSNSFNRNFFWCFLDFSDECRAFDNGVLKGFTAMFQCSGMISWTVFLAVFYLFWVTSLLISQCHQVFRDRHSIISCSRERFSLATCRLVLWFLLPKSLTHALHVNCRKHLNLW